MSVKIFFCQQYYRCLFLNKIVFLSCIWKWKWERFYFFMCFLRRIRVQTGLPDVLASQCIILIYRIFIEEYFKRTRYRFSLPTFFPSIVRCISDSSAWFRRLPFVVKLKTRFLAVILLRKYQWYNNGKLYTLSQQIWQGIKPYIKKYIYI